MSKKITLVISLFCCVFLTSGYINAQPQNISFSSVYTEKPGSNTPLWGHNASKACTVNGTRFFVGRERNAANNRPILYADDGQGWSIVWTGGLEDAKQNPVLVCDINNRIHIMYNRYSGTLAHYRFDTPSAAPLLINTSNLASHQIHYLAAAASSTSSQIYLAAYDNATSHDARTFNIYYYNDTQKIWYGPYNQTLSWKPAQGWSNTRNDGSYLYPVISAVGHRIFAAAALYPRAGNFTHRKHWAFWDSAYYGDRRVDHFYKDSAPGEQGHSETSNSNNYYVAPEAIKQIDDGTIFILSNIRGASAASNLNAVYLNVYANSTFIRHKIPSAIGGSGLTATDKAVIVVDKVSIHWSCDRGETWKKQAHDARNQITNSGQLNNFGYTHVMSDIESGKVDAFFGLMFKDVDSNPAENLRSEILNLRFDTSSFCN